MGQRTAKLNRRRQLLKLREQIPSGLRSLKSRRILRRLEATPELQSARRPAFYYSWGAEVETLVAIKKCFREGKTPLLPVIVEDGRLDFHPATLPLDEMQVGVYGIPAPDPDQTPPIPVEEIDLVVAPGVGFDPFGNRLGQGGGYYDRFLSRLPQDVPVIGLAFEKQMVPELETDEGDRRVHKVITERTTYAVQDREWISESPEATHKIASRIADRIAPPCLIRLSGELGAGKTEWTRGLLAHKGWQGRVKSPTFTLENVYDLEDGGRIVHLDGYRLDSPSLIDVDRFGEIMEDPSSLVLVEWPEKFGDEIGPFTPRVTLERIEGGRRRIAWRAFELGHHL